MSFIAKQLGGEHVDSEQSITGEASSFLLRVIAAGHVVLSVIGSLLIWQQFGETSLFPSPAERHASHSVIAIAIAVASQGVVISGLLLVVADIGEHIREIRKSLQGSVVPPSSRSSVDPSL